MSFTPSTKVNRHTVRIDDCDMGTVVKEVDVPTGRAFLWYFVCMSVQTSGSLRLGERINIGRILFEVVGIKDGWYEISTGEIKATKFEMWDAEMLIEKLNCKI